MKGKDPDLGDVILITNSRFMYNLVCLLEILRSASDYVISVIKYIYYIGMNIIPYEL